MHQLRALRETSASLSKQLVLAGRTMSLWELLVVWPEQLQLPLNRPLPTSAHISNPGQPWTQGNFIHTPAPAILCLKPPSSPHHPPQVTSSPIILSVLHFHSLVLPLSSHLLPEERSPLHGTPVEASSHLQTSLLLPP